MQTKSQSCDRCLRQNSGLLTNTLEQPKTIKKPQSYLAKKFQQLYDQDRKWRDKKRTKIEQTIKQKEQKEVSGCTFKPETNNNPEYHINNDSFLKREVDWKRSIDRKIEQKRQQLAKKQIQKFSFQPKITDFSLLSSQVKQTKTINSTNNYSKKLSFTQKKSYKLLHSERKKFKQIAKSTIVEPFKHRRIQSKTQANQHLQNSMNDVEINNHKQKKQIVSSPLKLTKLIEIKAQKNKQKEIQQHQQNHQKLEQLDHQENNNIQQNQQEENDHKIINQQNTNQEQIPNMIEKGQIYPQAEQEEQGEQF